jgi:hypothetical protein
LNIPNDADYEWRLIGETPEEHSRVAFELIHDPVRRIGIFRNLLYIESGATPRVWSPEAIQRWIYLDQNGAMATKAK